MTSRNNNQSSFGSIICTTNIPGSKEFTLDPKDIFYSDYPDFKTSKTTSKLYYYSHKIIHREFLQGQSRPNMLNILFNKNRFNKITDDHFDDASKSERDKIVNANVIAYIETLFTTFPKSYNIKKTSEMNNHGGLKISLPLTNIPYTYLSVNGTTHTVSRVVYYDDKQKNNATLELLNKYSEFEQWYQDKNFSKVFTDPLVKDFKKLFDSKMNNNNLSNTFGDGRNGTPPNFKNDTLKNTERIKSINDYIFKSDTIPSDLWSSQKLVDWFFSKTKNVGNESKLLVDGTTAFATLMQFEGNVNDTEMQTEVNKRVAEFKQAVSVASILNKTDNLLKQTLDNINKFKLLVEGLDASLNAINGEWNNSFWVRLKPSGNDARSTPKVGSISELNKEIENAEYRIALIKKQEDIYKRYNNDDGNGSSLTIAKIMSDLAGYKYKGTVEYARTDEEINSFKQAVETLFINYKILFNLNKSFINASSNASSNDIYDKINEAYKSSRIISDQLTQIKKPVAVSSSLFPSHKFSDILVLLRSFQTHYAIYNNFRNKMYNTDILNSKYDKYTGYKEYINFVKKIHTLYRHNDEFKLGDMNSKIVNGELREYRNDSGFENESIRLHIDLIKGKVSDENVKQIACKYNDYDLVERWNNLDVIEDDGDDIVHMHYFTVDDNVNKGKKQIKKGGKRTKRYHRGTKRKQTRKR